MIAPLKAVSPWHVAGLVTTGVWVWVTISVWLKWRADEPLGLFEGAMAISALGLAAFEHGRKLLKGPSSHDR